MTDKKITVLTISDMPFSPSGVGTQTKYVCEALLKSGKFKIISLGGAIKHPKHDPLKTEEWGDDWIVYPVDHFGNPDIVRSIMRTYRPDILWFMTDPRFYEWLWMMSDEIRPLVPMVYYHVWDNYPYPKFNKPWYLSTDKIVAISKLTHDIVKNVSPETDTEYLPHAVNSKAFSRMDEEDRKKIKAQNFPQWEKDKFLFFWNNRNARRKLSGSVLWWFKEFLDEVGHDKATLLMHTEPLDPNGQNLNSIMSELGLVNGEVLISQTKLPMEQMSAIYNMADCTLNISDAEGFGLSTLESLACGTPIVVNMTGGLQEQVTDGENWFGIGIEAVSKAVVGSQQVPFIYEDRVSKEQFVGALKEIYNMPDDQRKKMIDGGIKHVEENYNFETFNRNWIDLMLGVHEKYGSWENRKGYNAWECLEIGE
tara:strand:- start:164 stop:1432 length:1269 start_codon:yes stop_codon:yes gene_type:complete